MATSYTSLLGLALPVTGELSGTWGNTVNTEITALLDSAIAGTTTISADADVTLTTTTGAANTSRQIILLWTAAGTLTRNITAPAQSKTYVVINKSSSTQSIVLRGVGPTTGVTIIKGEAAVCAWNGTDFIKVANISGAGTFSSITNTGLTMGRVVYSTTGGLETDSANLTFNGTTLTAAGLAGPFNGTVGATTASTGAFTTLSASSTVSGAGFSTYLASPPAIGGTAAAAGTFTNLTYTGTLTGSTGVLAIGTSQIYKDATGKVGLGTVSPAVTFAVSATDAILVPNGTTAQRPTGAAGYIRYNSTTASFEGYTSAWGSIGGGATGAGGDQVFYENGQTVNTSYSITASKNAGSFGPITVASAVTVTVPTGSTWSIV